MKYGMAEIDWEYIGAVFATAGDDEQVKFFRSMLKEMSTWETAHQGEMQLACINAKFTDDEKDRISMLGYKGED
jgi:hypothetical protein